jgi:uncharacterized RDD family membrane protein YckC
MAFTNPHLDDPGQAVEAASRMSRFVARLVDTAIWFAPLPLLLFPCLGAMAALFVWAAILTGQLYLLVTRGQSIGKYYLKIYIMRSDGGIPNVGWLLVREFALPAAVGLFRYFGHNDPTALGQGFQFLLTFFWLIDGLFIFGPTRRCLHDFVAGTHVVKAE